MAAPRDSNDSSTDYDTERVTSISKGCFDNSYWSFPLSYNHFSEAVKSVPEGSENEEKKLCKVGSSLQCSLSISYIYIMPCLTPAKVASRPYCHAMVQ